MMSLRYHKVQHFLIVKEKLFFSFLKMIIRGLFSENYAVLVAQESHTHLPEKTTKQQRPCKTTTSCTCTLFLYELVRVRGQALGLLDAEITDCWLWLNENGNDSVMARYNAR